MKYHKRVASLIKELRVKDPSTKQKKKQNKQTNKQTKKLTKTSQYLYKSDGKLHKYEKTID